MFKNLKFLLVLMSLLFSPAIFADDVGAAVSEGVREEGAFTRSDFNSFADYIAYYDKHLLSTRPPLLGDLSYPSPQLQSRLVQAIFSNMIKTADLFFAFNPSADAVKAFLELPLQPLRETMRDMEVQALVIALQRAVAPQVFERATNVSDWIRIATFTPVSAAEFESMAAEIVYQNFDSFLALNPSFNEIKELISGQLGLQAKFKVLKLFCEALPQGEGYTSFVAERNEPIKVAERFTEFLLSPSSFYEADPESIVARSGRELLVKTLKSMIEREDAHLRVVVSREKMLALKEICRAAGYEMITAQLVSSVVYPKKGPETVSYEITRLGKIPKLSGERFDRGARRGSEIVGVPKATGEVRRDEAPREERGIVERIGGWFRRAGARK